MSAIALLMGLLVLSYLGSLLVGLGRTRGGLASGIEFIGLGFVVGPHALGVLDRPIISEFEPVVQVALGWLAFVVGLDFGRVEGRRVKTASTILGIVCALVTGGIVAFAVWEAIHRMPHPWIDEPNLLILAAGAGAVTAETARNAVEWVQARWNASGPLSRLLVDIGASDDLAPFVMAGAIFAFAPTAGIKLELPAVGWFGAAFALGAGLGIVTAMLLRGAEGDAVWGALIGTILLAVGAAARFGFCTIFVTFVMGIALAAASPSRRALRKVVSPTERAVLYPMLLLAGARIDLRPLAENRMLAAMVALVLVARIAGKIISGLVVRAATPVAKPAGPLMGIVMLSSGPVSIACGLAFALRFPGPIGDTLLVAAVSSALLGEIVATLSLRALFIDTGEIQLASVAGTSGTVPPPPSSHSVIPPAKPSVPPPPHAGLSSEKMPVAPNTSEE